MNEQIMIEGKDCVDFNYRHKAYEIICEANRMIHLAVQSSKIRFKTTERSDQAYDKYEKEFNKLDASIRKTYIVDFSNIIADRIEDRNPNNLLD